MTFRLSRWIVPATALAFGISVILSRYAIVHGAGGRSAFLWSLLPALPASVLAVLLVRYAEYLDELEQRLHLGGLAFALAAMSVSTLVVGLLQKAQIVGVDATLWLWLVGVAAYLVGYWLNRRRFR